MQGVGFRPFVWRLAREYGVAGWVKNDAEGVLIHAEGGDHTRFLEALRRDAPPISAIDAIEPCETEAKGAEAFNIVLSQTGQAATRVAPDLATCPDCLEEVTSPGRRQGYAFTNCTNCGPRLSIVVSVPYDRQATTMRGFEMCPACRAEYDDPADRRFHAQPIACPDCGPRLSRSVEDVAQELRAGSIVAIKGIGGYHLVLDATNVHAIDRLRVRKKRPTKPLALMASSPRMVEAHCKVSPDERALLQDPAAPVLLLPRRQDCDLPDRLAPGLDLLGWMLPMTPLHHLLMHAVGKPVVMTSGNLSGRPQATTAERAEADLAGIADSFLHHDRPIARRLDDSVAQLAAGGLRVHRRARGYAPAPVHLPGAFAKAPPVLAFGAHLKSTFCLGDGQQALMSHHLGDLDDPDTVAEYERALDDYRVLFDHDPELAVCDLHPDYRSTRLAEASGLPLMRVAHHHAHMAAAMAENGWKPDDGPVAGIVLDGLGLGPDGELLGGELLLGGYAQAETIARLKPVALPGGEAAQREPWRNLFAQLHAAGLEARAAPFIPGKPLDQVSAMIDGGFNAPLCSSAGRLFDAVAAALGLAPEKLSFEGEAAMRLEAVARRGSCDAGEGYPFAIETGGALRVIDPAPMWVALLSDLENGTSHAEIARRFHVGLADVFCDEARRAGAAGVALSGGCFHNATLLEAAISGLSGDRVLSHSTVPAGDGGIALGQIAIAAARTLDVFSSPA